MQPSSSIFSECYLGTKCSGSTRTGFRDIGDFLDSLEAWDRAHKVGAPSRSTLTILVWCQDQSDWRRRRIGVPSAPPKLPANKVAPLDSCLENLQSLSVADRSEEHTSELQSLMRISYAVFCLKKKNNTKPYT